MYYCIRSIAVALICLLPASVAFAEENVWPADMRFSLYGSGSSIDQEGESSSFSELVASFSLFSPYGEKDGLEYGVDLRSATYPSTEERPSRFSLYNAYVGYKFGSYSVRAGQMWLNELGSLGSIGGAAFQWKGPDTSAGTIRIGGFGGKEPEILDAGYSEGVNKFGGYFALDGENGRRHIVGYMNMQNSGLTERSVILFNNYLPAGNQFFLFQSAEFDLVGPADLGDGGLNYFFINGRYNHPSRRFELQGVYHHGRSVDTRSITEDQLNGRPVPASTLEGLLYESATARVTVKTVQNLFVFGSAGSDKNNRDEERTNRFTVGAFSSELLHSGIDMNISATRYDAGDAPSYDSWSFSAGRNLSDAVYLSGSYYSSASLVRFTSNDQVVIETGPRTDLWEISGLIHLNRAISILTTFDYTDGKTYTEKRFMAGITYRFRPQRSPRLSGESKSATLK